MIRIYKTVTVLLACMYFTGSFSEREYVGSYFTGCFSAKEYVGPSRRDNHNGSVTYTFRSRDYRKGTSINVDRWWKVQANADSCLTDDYIRKFFKLENGNIVPRYDKMVNRETWLNKTYDLDMGDYKVPDSAYLWLQINLITNSKFVTWDEEQEVWYIQRFGGKIDASINGDGGENLGVEKIVNYDEDGNIEKITYWTFYRPLSGSECLFENGSGYYVDPDFIETVDTLTQNVNTIQLPRPRAGYDENGYFFLNHRRALNDSMTVVTRIQAYAAEEGQVENNCKVGEWKYRDSAGELVRTEYYSLRDRVDVRFPHRFLINADSDCKEAILNGNKNIAACRKNLSRISGFSEQQKITINGRPILVKDARTEWNNSIISNNEQISTINQQMTDFQMSLDGYKIANPAYTFKEKTTDSIMDYDSGENDRIHFYKHQWEAMNKTLDLKKA